MASTETCSDNEIQQLKAIINEKEKELEYLKKKLQDREKHLNLSCAVAKDVANDNELRNGTSLSSLPVKLTNHDIARYSRQLILPEIGVKGQLALQSTSVLIVGCGGLGCPVAIYLAAAGIGKIGLVDYDEVELSNLHRQILHTESRIGIDKSLSVAEACQSVNSLVRCVPYHVALDSANALQIVEQYDIIVDATDNVATRYLLSDACVLTCRPLVSGSALRFEGQLTVYNFKESPCYRCLYPVPPSPEAVTNCSDGGVLGAVVGVIGSLQALDVIKIATNSGLPYCERMLNFDGFDGSFRTVKLRGKRKDCCACGDSPTIDRLIDYEQFCGAKATDKNKDLYLLKEEDRISVSEYRKVVERQERHLLIDVRHSVEIDICKLHSTTDYVPIEDFDKVSVLEKLKEKIENDRVPVYVICRMGNDSQLAVDKIRRYHPTLSVPLLDISGGLHAWARNVDPTFPVY